MSDDITDWELLNAYADDELSAPQRDTIEQRLENEPDLKAQLDDINHAKNVLSILKTPQSASDDPKVVAFAQRLSKFKKWAMAASVVLCVTGGIALYDATLNKTFEQAAIESHQTLSEKTYVVDVASIQSVAWGSSHYGLMAPDLSGARLYLVDMQVIDNHRGEQITMHYRGLRGCSLSIVALNLKGTAPQETSFKFPEYLHYEWVDKGFQFVVLAKGMDTKRFQTVSFHTQNTMREQLHKGEEKFASLNYKRNSPCV